jgi:hypothetical protein
LRQLPLPLWSKLLVRIDGVAFSHEVLDHLRSLSNQPAPGALGDLVGDHAAVLTGWPEGCG